MSRPILLLNCGSSSLKYQVIDADSEEVLGSGIVQRIGDVDGTIDHKVDGTKHHVDVDSANHVEALNKVVELFGEHGPDISNTIAVGHRTVHGGEEFMATTIIDENVIAKLREQIPLAPLHNPACIAGIEAGRKLLPDVPHVAIFDTAFFAELPAEAHTYAIPREIATEHHLRRYGFHGTSHRYVSHATAELLGKPYNELRQIVCHLGNGASVSAIDRGRPVETSMGLTPLEGLVMGTRSGDVDPGLHAFLGRELGMSVEEIDTLLNKKSGVFGLCGMIDMREVEDAAVGGHQEATHALSVYVHRLVKYIGAYMGVLGGLDAITFTAGVGENSDIVRDMVCKRLEGWGFRIDDALNRPRSKEARVVSAADSPIAVCVVPTNEELAMARETVEAIST